MATKELQTRIALKYDSYASWTDTSVEGKGANLVLLKGEIGICEIPVVNADSNVAPTVLFKVGGAKYPEGHDKAGQLMAFKDLPWASAKAADVYSWAKKSEAEFKTWLDTTAGFATDAEVETIRATLAAQISALEANVGSSGNIGSSVADHETRLDVLEGDGEGSVAKALADATAYTNTREAVITTAYQAYADQAEADAKSYVDTAVSTINAKDSAQDAEIAKKLDKTTYETYINGKAMSDAELKSYALEIAAAAQTAATTAATTAAASDATNKVNALKLGEVATNTAAISAIDAAYQAADTALGSRITTVETKLANVSNVMDFIGARSVSVSEDAVITVTGNDGETFNKGDVVVDNGGKEYVYDGTVWHEFGYADGNTAAIEGLQSRMTTAEGEIDTLQSKDNELVAADTALGARIDDVISAYQAADTTTLNTAKAYAEEKAAAAESAAKSHAEAKASAAQSAAESTAKSYTDGQVDILEAADTAMSGEITALKQVTSGYAGEKAIKNAVDAKLATEDFNSWKGTHEADHAGTATEITTEITNAVNAEQSARETAINEVNADISAVKARIDAYDTRFGTASDILVFNCGSATDVI